MWHRTTFQTENGFGLVGHPTMLTPSKLAVVCRWFQGTRHKHRTSKYQLIQCILFVFWHIMSSLQFITAIGDFLRKPFWQCLWYLGVLPSAGIFMLFHTMLRFQFRHFGNISLPHEKRRCRYISQMKQLYSRSYFSANINRFYACMFLHCTFVYKSTLWWPLSMYKTELVYSSYHRCIDKIGRGVAKNTKLLLQVQHLSLFLFWLQNTYNNSHKYILKN